MQERPVAGEPASKCEKQMAMLAATYQNLANSGVYGLLFFVLIVLLINMVAMWTPYQVRSEDVLTFTNASGLLNKTNMPLMYNSLYSNQEPNLIALNIAA